MTLMVGLSPPYKTKQRAGWIGYTGDQGTQAEPARFGATAGGKPDGDERLRSERTGFLPVAGDRSIAGGSAGHSWQTR